MIFLFFLAHLRSDPNALTPQLTGVQGDVWTW